MGSKKQWTEKKIIDGYAGYNFGRIDHFVWNLFTSKVSSQGGGEGHKDRNVEAVSEIALNQNTRVQKYTKINKCNMEIR